MKVSHAQFKAEAAARLEGFSNQLQMESTVDLSAKNLGDEGCAFVINSAAFNERCEAYSPLPKGPPASTDPSGDQRCFA